MQSWQRGLCDLRSSFERHFDSDLHIFLIQADVKVEAFDPGWMAGGTGPITLPPPEYWRGEKPVIDDTCKAYEGYAATTGEVYLRRRVFFGHDASRLPIFFETAMEAGPCVEGISPSSLETRDWALRWIDFLVGLAVRRVPGSALRRKPVPTPFFPCLEYNQNYILLSTNLFRASALAIDTILEHFGDSSQGESRQERSSQKNEWNRKLAEFKKTLPNAEQQHLDIVIDILSKNSCPLTQKQLLSKHNSFSESTLKRTLSAAVKQGVLSKGNGYRLPYWE